MKKRLVSGVLLSAILLVGCGNKDIVLDENGEQVTEKTSADDEQTFEEQMAKEDAELVKQIAEPDLKVGNMRKWDNTAEMVIKKTGFDKKSNKVVVQKDGVLTLDVSLTYNGDGEKLVAYTDFILYDKDGNVYDGYYDFGDMVMDFAKKGHKVSGHLYYDVKAGQDYVLRYTPQFAETSQDDAFWSVGTIK